ncbi:MAG TPA: VOC family protein [Pyrinomonadaceae bacterium]|jgi:catechol 2,3-dioxygenase-like lactoylglutathione lyase family enzyme|nr:VOC family protein [Pyrinomonadaceae bacterium]
MGVRGLNHFNITASREVIERVRDFYVGVLGLRVGERPGFRRAGFWLYAGREPVVHLTAEDGDDARTPHARSTFDHVAFSCEGLREFVGRLERAGVEYEADEVASLGQVQLFLRDPAGVGLELNFTGETLALKESA